MEVLINCLKGLGLAALHNFWLAEVYKIMNKSRRENYVMMQSMVFISVILAGAMMVIGNNLAVAFGLVGAVSIVRFRMNVGSIMDMSFIFLSIVIGMACGLGFYFIATVIAVFTGVLMICIHFSSFGKKFFQNSVELEITISFPRSTLENMPDKDQIMKAISETFLCPAQNIGRHIDKRGVNKRINLIMCHGVFIVELLSISVNRFTASTSF